MEDDDLLCNSDNTKPKRSGEKAMNLSNTVMNRKTPEPKKHINDDDYEEEDDEISSEEEGKNSVIQKNSNVIEFQGK
jgi:hypothetical protein